MLNNVSKHYFNRTLPSLSSDKVDLQPSAVIEAVIKTILETSDCEQQYQLFLHRLNAIQPGIIPSI